MNALVPKQTVLAFWKRNTATELKHEDKIEDGAKADEDKASPYTLVEFLAVGVVVSSQRRTEV